MSTRSHDEKSIFEAASKLRTPSEQIAYVERICAADPALKGRILTLLEADEGKGDFLEALLDEPSASLDGLELKEGPGTVVGRYKLLERIGEGGMAVVYMAEQEKPIRRKVALKIIKLGMDTKSVIARFEAERQALAMMDHPNIAKVFDAGATETGRPYFVMELVQGVSITEYCDRNKLSTKERLGLFIQICNAAQHAHQKGIIHRDIKPSNVMVTMHDGQARPKVIDFGIAKATNQKLTEKTLFTRYAHVIGTPAYMSPEQAELSDVDIDTRSDIYSLGVLLYELLTGQTPFSEEQLRRAGYLEMQRVIREQEPTKPSTKLSTLGDTVTDIAQRRNVTPDTLRRLIQGDLDWIVMKSLDKNRTRRYDTASALALDIQRHLDHEPVSARAPKLTYRLHKFLCRNRKQVAAVLVLILLIGALVMIFVAQNKSSAAEYLIHEKQLSQAKEAFVRGDYVTALNRAESIVDSKPLGPQARLLMANILVDWGEPNEATTILQGLLDDRPEIAGGAHLLMARVILETESSDSTRFTRITDHRQKADGLLPESADAFFQRAMTAVSIKEKLKSLDQALEHDRGHYESRRLRAYTSYASKKYKQMESDALFMTASQPEDPLGYSLRALALRETGAYEEAIAEYDKAIELTSENAQLISLHEQRCDTFLCLRAYQQAIAGAEQGLKGSADATILQFRKFCALTGQGDYEEASKLFHRATDNDRKAKNEFRNWSKKYVFDTLEADRSWHDPDREPKGAAFVSMLEAVDIYNELTAKGAWRVTTDAVTGNWSPQRDKLAFSMGVYGYSGLAVYDPSSQETELYMVPGYGPVWSPDGRYIAFTRDCRPLPLSQYTAVERKRHPRFKTDSELWIISADGTEPKRLAQCNRGGSLSWDQDSRHINYKLKQTFYRISIDDPGDQPQAIPSLSGVSPDRKKELSLIYGSLKIKDIASDTITHQWAGPLRIWGRDWSPDSNQISWAGFRNPEERTGLWIYDLNKRRAAKVFSGHITNADWSPDERALAICFGPPLYEVWGVDLDPRIPTIEALGPGRTHAQHCKEMIALCSGRIEVDPKDAESLLHRSMYHHYLNEKDKALADIQQYADTLYPPDVPNSRNSWIKNLLTELNQKPLLNPGSPVNTSAWDCPGSLSADGLRLYMHSDRTGGYGAKDLYMARRASTNDPWTEPENLGRGINTDVNDFEADISRDELTLLFVSDRQGGLGKADIWVSKRASIDAPWGPPVNLGPTINSSASDMDPSTTADGLTLYFSSRRAGGLGSCDIWVAKRATPKDPWGNPVNLGAPVNSGFTSCPDVSADGLALFFISMRSGGLGQSDIYVTTRSSIHDPWGPVVNLGPNINNHRGEEYPKISLDGGQFMFVANQPNGVGEFGIWQVEIPTMPAGSSINDSNTNQYQNE